MTLDDKRSPERILRYFELLEWKKNECGDRTREEVSERFRQELQLIEDELYTIEHLITEKNRLLLSNQGEMNQVKSNISYVEETIISLKQDIISVRNKIAEHRHSLSEETRSNSSKTSKYPNALTLGWTGIISQSFLGIREDIRALFLDIWKAIITLKISILAQYLLSLLIVIIFASQFDYYANTVFSLIFIALYVCFKFLSILRSINKNQQSISKERENFKKEAYRQKQILESHINDLEKSKEVQEKYLYQQKEKEKELNAQIQAIDNELESLKKSQERLAKLQQNKHSEIKNHESLLEELVHLDRLTANWLEQAIKKLIEKAKSKLKLIGSDYFDETEALKIEPIQSLIGCTSRTLPSLLVNHKDEDEDDDDDSPRRKEILKLCANDVKSAFDYSGKRKIYGLYEFTVFFLCSNFFTYYRCYYNFVRNKVIDEEYSEYLCDSIVFTKVQEKSSISQQNPHLIKISSKRLTISTNDGKIISLQINRSRGDKKLSSKLEKVDDAATEIRLRLR